MYCCLIVASIVSVAWVMYCIRCSSRWVTMLARYTGRPSRQGRIRFEGNIG